MASLTSLLRKSDCIVTDSIHDEWITWNDKCVRVVYNKQYDKNWTDEELCSNIIQLYCSNNQLTSLPDMPLCTWLNCSGNRLTSLSETPTVPVLPLCMWLDCRDNQLTSLSETPTVPVLPLCTRMDCSVNQLTSLSDLPLCTTLYCYKNRLTSLPDLPLCTKLVCSYNQLTSLSYLPLCTTLYCDVGMPFYDLSKWRKVWRTKELLLGRKYFTKWRVFVFCAKKRDLHDELKYSPELPFYKTLTVPKS